MQQYIDKGLARKNWGWKKFEVEELNADLFEPRVVRLQK
jgi:hypothetical protein